MGSTIRFQTPLATNLWPLARLGSLLLIVFAPAEATNLGFLPIGVADTLEYVSYEYQLPTYDPPTGQLPTETFRQFGLRQLGSNSLVGNRQRVDSADPDKSPILQDTFLVENGLVRGRTVSYELPDTVVESLSVSNGSYKGYSRGATITIYTTTTSSKSCRTGALKTGERFLACKSSIAESATDGSNSLSTTDQYFLEGVGEIRYAYNWRTTPPRMAVFYGNYGATTRELSMQRGQPFLWASYVAAIDAEVVTGVARSTSRTSKSTYRSGLLTNARIDVLGRAGSHTAIPYFQGTDRSRAKGD